jgi:hypothetical protein
MEDVEEHEPEAAPVEDVGEHHEEDFVPPVQGQANAGNKIFLHFIILWLLMLLSNRLMSNGF